MIRRCAILVLVSVATLADRAAPAAISDQITIFRIAHVQRSDGWIETTWNNMSDLGALAVAAAEEQEGGELPPFAGAGGSSV
jgi:hypothetical protein